MELIGDRIRTTNSTPSDMDRTKMTNKISFRYWMYIKNQVGDEIEAHVWAYMGPQDMVIHRTEEEMNESYRRFY